MSDDERTEILCVRVLRQYTSISLYGLVTLCNICFIVTPHTGVNCVNCTNKQSHIVSALIDLSLCSTSRSLISECQFVYYS